MRLVLDCSVALKCFVPEEGSAEAEVIAEGLVVLTADGPMTKAFGRLGLTQPLLP